MDLNKLNPHNWINQVYLLWVTMQMSSFHSQKVKSIHTVALPTSLPPVSSTCAARSLVNKIFQVLTLTNCQCRRLVSFCKGKFNSSCYQSAKPTRKQFNPLILSQSKCLVSIHRRAVFLFTVLQCCCHLLLTAAPSVLSEPFRSPVKIALRKHVQFFPV